MSIYKQHTTHRCVGQHQLSRVHTYSFKTCVVFVHVTFQCAIMSHDFEISIQLHPVFLFISYPERVLCTFLSCGHLCGSQTSFLPTQISRSACYGYRVALVVCCRLAWYRQIVREKSSKNEMNSSKNKPVRF